MYVQVQLSVTPVNVAGVRVGWSVLVPRKLRAQVKLLGISDANVGAIRHQI